MEQLIFEMMQFYSGDPWQIQHLMKVHGFARLIGAGEKLDPDMQQRLEIAAIVHDIGIKPAVEKHGSGSGKYQELEGPPVAEALLQRLGYPPPVIKRVCYLVGHHHTYDAVDEMDYQILVEADFLVNFFENEMSANAIQSTVEKVFRTQTGKEYVRLMFGVE